MSRIRYCLKLRHWGPATLLMVLLLQSAGCEVFDDDDDDEDSAVVAGGRKNGADETDGAETVDNDTDTSKLRILALANGGAWRFEEVPRGSESFGDSIAAVALSGRKALFTGGFRNNAATKAAFLYSATTRSWTQLSDMVTARNRHEMVRLANGKVLVVGGDDGMGHLLDAAELFDPDTQQFTPLSDMNEARGFFTAIALDDGRALIMSGNFSDSSPDPTAEVFNPATGQFTPLGTIAIDARACAKLPDGRVLVVGDGFDPTAIIFNPANNMFSDADDMAMPHGVLPTATALADGRVLIAGGVYDNPQSGFVTSNKTDIYDPTSETFSPGPDMSVARQRHVAIRLPDGLVLIAGGVDDSGVPHRSADLFDPSDNTITPLTSMLSVGRADFAGVALTD